MSKAKKMVDYRCPRCDRPLRGREEVALLVRLPRGVDRCRHCGLGGLRLVMYTDGLGECWFFQTGQPLFPEDERTQARRAAP